MTELSVSFKDNDGGVEISKQGNVIIASLIGSCGDDVIDFFITHMQRIAQCYENQPWAYLCNSADFQATTPSGERKLIANYRFCMNAGCVYDAYCYISPVGIAQTEKVMRANGNDKPISEILFDDEEKAMDYLQQKLTKYKKRHANRFPDME